MDSYALTRTHPATGTKLIGTFATSRDAWSFVREAYLMAEAVGGGFTEIFDDAVLSVTPLVDPPGCVLVIELATGKVTQLQARTAIEAVERFDRAQGADPLMYEQIDAGDLRFPAFEVRVPAATWDGNPNTILDNSSSLGCFVSIVP